MPKLTLPALHGDLGSRGGARQPDRQPTHRLHRSPPAYSGRHWILLDVRRHRGPEPAGAAPDPAHLPPKAGPIQ